MEDRLESMYLVTNSGLRKPADEFRRILQEDVPYTRTIGGLDGFINQAHDIKEKCEDYTVYGNDIKPYVGDDGIKLVVGDKPFYLSEWALRQFSNTIGIPASYALDMAKAGKYKLFIDNFTSWIQSHAAGKKMQVRTYDDHVRGVLSDSYQPVDSDYLLPQIRTGLMQSNMDFRVDKGIVNPEYANVRIISNSTINVGNDPHFTGFRIRSSDVGRSSIVVEFFVFRGRCSNGMLFGKHGGILIEKRHTSKDMIREGYFETLLAEQLPRVNDLVLMTSEALRDAKKYNLNDEMMQRVIDRFKSQTSFGERKAKLIFQGVLDRTTGYSDTPTLWSVSNALTELAQEIRTVEEAEKIEDFAGDLLFSKLGMSV